MILNWLTQCISDCAFIENVFVFLATLNAKLPITFICEDKNTPRGHFTFEF